MSTMKATTTGPLSIFGMKAVANRCMGTGAATSKRQPGPILALVDFVLTASSLALGLGTLFGIAALADMNIIDGSRLKFLLSIICPLITMAQFVSPIPVVLEAVRKLDVQNLPVPVFQSQAACNVLGMAYAIRIQNMVILASNLFGLACQTLYLCSYHYVLAANGQWIFFAVKLQTLFCIGLYVCTEMITLNFLGQIITLFNIVLFAAPLAKLGGILKTRNATSLPTAMTIVSAINNAVWTLYALLIEDIVVLLPSVLGFVLCFFQVLVLLWCFKVLPFDLGFLLLPCRASVPQKKVAVEDDVELDENWENPEVTRAVTPNDRASLKPGA